MRAPDSSRRTSAAPPAEPHWSVRAAPLRSVPALLGAHGLDAAAVMGEFGFAIDAFEDPDAWVPFNTVTLLLGHAARLTGRDDLGLLLAEQSDAQVLGPLAQRMMLAPTVGSALKVLRRDFHLHDRGAVPYLLDLGQGLVALGYLVQRHGGPGDAVVYDLAAGIALKLMRALCGDGFNLQRVQLPHTPPKDPKAFTRHFGAPVVFDGSQARLDFATHWLERPLAGAQAAQRAHLDEAARAEVAGSLRSNGERVRSVAHALLMTGGLSEARIAAELGLHVRTLRRRLAAEGLQAQALIHEVRDQFAQQLLAETRLSVADIAQAAQYAEVASFSRAFRRRVGLAPGRWRALNRPADRR